MVSVLVSVLESVSVLVLPVGVGVGVGGVGVGGGGASMEVAVLPVTSHASFQSLGWVFLRSTRLIRCSIVSIGATVASPQAGCVQHDSKFRSLIELSNIRKQ